MLSHVLLEDPDAADDPDSWQAHWRSFPRIAFGFTDPPPEPIDRDDAHADAGEHRDWIDRAVRHCAKARGLSALLTPAPDENV